MDISSGGISAAICVIVSGMNETKISDPDVVRDIYDAEAEDLPDLVIDAPCGSGHMLSMYLDDFDQEHALLGIDLSRRKE